MNSNLVKKFHENRWKRINKEYLSSKNIVFCEGSNLHPSFKMYKYYWWIFAHNCEYNTASDIFYKELYKLTTKDAMEKMNELELKKIPFAYVNKKFQRLGCSVWNYSKIKIDNPNIQFAPSYEDDIDEEWNYHK